jgi:hypothetical protein
MSFEANMIIDVVWINFGALGQLSLRSSVTDRAAFLNFGSTYDHMIEKLNKNLDSRQSYNSCKTQWIVGNFGLDFFT